MKPGDLLTVRLPDETRSPYLLTSDLPVAMLYEDPYMIIVNKPPGMNTIPSQLHPHDSLIEAVYGKLSSQENIVLHPVSRLDRNTSGVVVFAKHQLFHHLLTGKIEKFYQLLCSGKVKTQGNICMPIARTDDSIITRQVSITGLHARTEYELLKYDLARNCSLVKAKLHTGRTHQIRVHFQSIGHSLLGDTLYGDDTQITRHALHAYEVRFNHPVSGKKIIIKAPLAKDLSDYFDMV